MGEKEGVSERERERDNGKGGDKQAEGQRGRKRE